MSDLSLTEDEKWIYYHDPPTKKFIQKMATQQLTYAQTPPAGRLAEKNGFGHMLQFKRHSMFRISPQRKNHELDCLCCYDQEKTGAC